MEMLEILVKVYTNAAVIYSHMKNHFIMENMILSGDWFFFSDCYHIISARWFEWQGTLHGCSPAPKHKAQYSLRVLLQQWRVTWTPTISKNIIQTWLQNKKQLWRDFSFTNTTRRIPLTSPNIWVTISIWKKFLQCTWMLWSMSRRISTLRSLFGDPVGREYAVPVPWIAMAFTLWPAFEQLIQIWVGLLWLLRLGICLCSRTLWSIWLISMLSIRRFSLIWNANSPKVPMYDKYPT